MRRIEPSSHINLNQAKHGACQIFRINQSSIPKGYAHSKKQVTKLQQRNNYV